MNLQAILEQRTKVEAFQRKHRIGLLTLLFTDLVGSTRLKQELGDQQAVALIQRHHALVREILSRFNEGEEIGTAGDSFFLVFTKPSDAVQFALRLQNRLRTLSGETARPLLDRVGIHIGEVVVEERPDSPKPKDLYGLQVDVCARVMSLAEGDQILLTRSAFDNARQVLKGQDIEGLNALNGLQWLNHGPYVLKGVEEPLEVCEVGEVGVAVLKPPADSEKVHRHVSPDAEPVLGWRPAIGQGVPGTSWVLEAKLGEGGFGEVWVGQHTTTKERRVFKFCFRADRVRPLKREITLFRLLKERVGEHPNIVKVHDVFLDEPPYYLAMEYVAGRDLKTWSEERGGLGSVPLAARLEILAQVADALQAAHDAGVIHRDVKPSNILVSGQWPGVSDQKPEHRGSGADAVPARVPRPLPLVVKLTDFGIGQVASREALAGLTRMGFTQTLISPSSTSHTGTFMYMAPELVAGNPASKQSDIYSLGVVLYQLILGELTRPVTSDWSKQISDPVLREDLDRCFAGHPAERFGAARELAARLRSLEKRHQEQAGAEAAVVARQDAECRSTLRRAGLVAALIIMASFLLVLSQFYQFAVNGHANYWQTNIFLLAAALGACGGLWTGASDGRVRAGILGALGGCLFGASVGIYLNLTQATATGVIAVTIFFGVLTFFPIWLLQLRATARVRRARINDRSVSLKEVIDASQRRMVYCAGAAAIWITLFVLLFYAEEDWRGARAWERTRQRLESKGEHLDWAYFIPRSVPDDENFFKAPAMAEWFQRDARKPNRTAPTEKFPELPPWLNSIPPSLEELRSWEKFRAKNPSLKETPGETDPAAYLLQWFDQYDAQLKKIQAACARRTARMEGSYDFGYVKPLENFLHFRVAAQILATKAKAHLLKSQPEAAGQDLATFNRLRECLGGRTLVSAMIRVAIGGIYVNAIGESVTNASWNDAQLEMIQKQLGRLNLLSEAANGLRADRALALQVINFTDQKVRERFPDSLEDFGWSWYVNAVLRIGPSGWLRQNWCAASELPQGTLDGVDAQDRRLVPGKIDLFNASTGRITPYNFVAWPMTSNLRKALETAGRNQSLAAEGMIACALERYRRAHGAYAASLDALTPQLIDQLPHDVINGQPHKYRLLENGGFLLYSVGWDEKDDGGDEKSDWVWPYSQTRRF